MHNQVIIDIVEEENNLVKYTDDHFINKLNADLEKVRVSREPSEFLSKVHNLNDTYRYSQSLSNSPISMSANNSDSESDDVIGVKRFTFREVRDSIHKYYSTEHKYVNELDLLTTYLKCQKHLYLHSASISGFKMKFLAIPACIGSGMITICSSFGYFEGVFISGINIIVWVCIFFIYYFQFLPSISFYLQISKQFEKIENISECSANQYGFLDKSIDKIEYVHEHLRELEKKYMELKEMNTIMVPRDIIRLYSIGYHIQIFSFIKRIETTKNILIVRLKDMKNEIRYIESKFESKYKSRLDFLIDTKEKLKSQIVEYCCVYGSMETILSKEMRSGSHWYMEFGFNKKIVFDNSVVKNYCNSIVADD